MRTNRIALIFAIVALLAVAPSLSFACGEGEPCSCNGSGETKTCATEAAKIAKAAEGGCEASMEKLVAWAKESDDKETAMLAVKAEGGCEKSQAALIAKAKGANDSAAPAGCNPSEASMSELAVKAEGGCPAASAALIAMAKDSDNAEAAKLAAKAEGGCEHSKAALIAMAKKTDEN